MRIALSCIALAGSLLLASCTGKAGGTPTSRPTAPPQPVSTKPTTEGVEVTIGTKPRIEFLLPSGWQPVPWRPGGPESVPTYHSMFRHTPTNAEIMFFGSFHGSQREAEMWYTRMLPEQKLKTAEGLRSRGPRWVQYTVTARGKRNLVLNLGQGNFIASANALMNEGAPSETLQAAEKGLESLRDTFEIVGAAPTQPTRKAPAKPAAAPK